MARSASTRTKMGDALVAPTQQSEPNGGTEGPIKTINLLRLRKAFVDVRIIGLAPYIPHAWSAKSRQMMPGHPLRDQIEEKKAPHNPEAEALACLYLMPDDGRPIEERLGAPATAFKSAMIKAVGLYQGLTKVNTKLLLHVAGQGPEQLIPVTADMELKEDTPRNANFSVDLRYRYYLWPWSAVVRIIYFPSVITADSVVSLLDTGGAAGIGDWRPSAPKSETGTYGTWEVEEVVGNGMVEERARWTDGNA